MLHCTYAVLYSFRMPLLAARAQASSERCVVASYERIHATRLATAFHDEGSNAMRTLPAFIFPLNLTLEQVSSSETLSQRETRPRTVVRRARARRSGNGVELPANALSTIWPLASVYPSVLEMQCAQSRQRDSILLQRATGTGKGLKFRFVNSHSPDANDGLRAGFGKPGSLNARGFAGGSGGDGASGMNASETVPLPPWSPLSASNDDDDDDDDDDDSSAEMPDGSEAGEAASRPRRALLLISDTGGGHRASAYAIRDAMNELYPGAFEWFIVDMWAEWTLWPFSSMPQSYQFLAKNPPLWRATYCYGSFPLTRRLTEEVTNAILHDRIRAAINCIRPDLVISLHPLTQMLPLRVLKKMGIRERIPFVTVVTDLGGAHATWFDPDADLVFVASDAVRQLAIRCGVHPERIRQHGLPVRPEFWADAERNYESELESLNRAQRILESRRAWRRRLGFLAEHRRTVLIVGGGDGVGGLTRIARAVVERLDALATELRAQSPPASPQFQVIVVCGRNERARNELTRWARERQSRHGDNAHTTETRTNLTVFGFVSNMGELMAAADAIVTKAGPGTIAEALIRGVPIMLSGFLPGQEEGNVPFVVNHGVGEYHQGPVAIANRLAEWLADETLLLRMAIRARDLGKPLATYEICQDIAELAQRFPGYPDTPNESDTIMGQAPGNMRELRNGNSDRGDVGLAAPSAARRTDSTDAQRRPLDATCRAARQPQATWHSRVVSVS